MLCVAGSARAEGPSQVESVPRSPTIAFLEQRVVEELAAEGVMLKQRNLALRIEQAGRGVLVSILDATTGQEQTWARVAGLPADREAGVAAVTHVAADLVSKLSATAAPSKPEPPEELGGEEGGVEGGEVGGEWRSREREDGGSARPASPFARAAALAEYRRDAIRFTPRFEVSVGRHSHDVGSVFTGSVTGVGMERLGWPAVRGESGVELEPTEFYSLVGRPELAESYQRRQKLGIGGIAIGGGVLAVGTYLLAKSIGISTDSGRCDALFNPGTLAEYDQCAEQRSEEAASYRTPALILGALGIAIAGGGYMIYRNSHPITENEAKLLAEDYNRQLRHRLHLNGDDSPTRDREAANKIQLAPYVGSKSGVVVTASF
ncbi:MAG: hypothetical protein AB7O24_03690 [Kofleriaceae bacterium]